MNPSDPDLKNVTPLEPLEPLQPVVAASPSNALPARRTIGSAASPSSVRTRLVAVLVLVAIVAIGYKLLHHHRNAYESTADAVTTALVNDNMTPVLHKFAAARLPELENHERVGRISNNLAPLGKFKGSKETTPADAEAGLHEFTETFANGTYYEKFELDSAGKIIRFHIGPQPGTSSAP